MIVVEIERSVRVGGAVKADVVVPQEIHVHVVGLAVGGTGGDIHEGDGGALGQSRRAQGEDQRQQGEDQMSDGIVFHGVFTDPFCEPRFEA